MTSFSVVLGCVLKPSVFAVLYLAQDLSRMDVRNVEHYFLVIGAMEENFRVYQTLKQELTQVLCSFTCSKRFCFYLFIL